MEAPFRVRRMSPFVPRFFAGFRPGWNNLGLSLGPGETTLDHPISSFVRYVYTTALSCRKASTGAVHFYPCGKGRLYLCPPNPGTVFKRSLKAKTRTPLGVSVFWPNRIGPFVFWPEVGFCWPFVERPKLGVLSVDLREMVWHSYPCLDSL